MSKRAKSILTAMVIGNATLLFVGFELSKTEFTKILAVYMAVTVTVVGLLRLIKVNDKD